MMPHPQSRRRALLRRTDAIRLAALAIAALIVQGCATPPQPPPVELPPVAIPPPRGPLVARDDDYAIVVPAVGDDFGRLAQRYLGDASKAWRIAEFNGIDRAVPGQAVVIPLRARNPIGVQQGGYQAIPILCYHRFGPKTSKLTVSRAAFEAQMEYLAHNGYHVVRLEELQGFLEGKQALPKKTVAITIDDGFRSTYEIAFPVLRKHGFSATVFLYTDFVGASDALTWPQMKEMMASRLIEIQPHSKSHANLTLRLADESEARYRERVRREVETPVGTIKDRLEVPSATFAYPYGDVNEIVVGELTRAGVSIGLTVTPGGNGFFADPYMLRRSMIFGNEDMEAFKAKLATFVRTSAR